MSQGIFISKKTQMLSFSESQISKPTFFICTCFLDSPYLELLVYQQESQDHKHFLINVQLVVRLCVKSKHAIFDMYIAWLSV